MSGTIARARATSSASDRLFRSGRFSRAWWASSLARSTSGNSVVVSTHATRFSSRAVISGFSSVSLCGCGGMSSRSPIHRRFQVSTVMPGIRAPIIPVAGRFV